MIGFLLKYPVSGYAYTGSIVVTVDSEDEEVAAERLYSRLKSSSKFNSYLEDTNKEDFVGWVLGEGGFESGSFSAERVFLDDIEELS